MMKTKHEMNGRSTKVGLTNTRIIFFLGYVNPYPGAGWTRIGFFAEYLAKRGCKVYVVGSFSPRSLSNAGSSIWRNLRILNVVPAHPAIPTHPAENKILSLFDVLSSVITLIFLSIILRPKIVVISVPSGKQLTPLGAYVGARASRAKVIFDYRDEWEDARMRETRIKIFRKSLEVLKRIMSSLYAKSDLVLAVTPHFIRGLKARGIKKIKMIPNGADINIFEPYDKSLERSNLRLPHDAFIIIYSGRIGNCYRLDIVVKALSKVTKKMMLAMIGDGHDLPSVLKLANENDVRVVYLGEKNDKKEIAKILSAADVGVVPYDDNPLWKNTLPAKFFEYCACNLPVIATTHRDSMLANLICENRVGLICKPLNVKGLAEAIEKLYEDEIFREEAGRNARLLIEQNFDRNKIAEEFLKILVDLLKVN